MSVAPSRLDSNDNSAGSMDSPSTGLTLEVVNRIGTVAVIVPSFDVVGSCVAPVEKSIEQTEIG